MPVRHAPRMCSFCSRIRRPAHGHPALSRRDGLAPSSVPDPSTGAPFLKKLPIFAVSMPAAMKLNCDYALPRPTLKGWTMSSPALSSSVIRFASRPVRQPATGLSQTASARLRLSFCWRDGQTPRRHLPKVTMRCAPHARLQLNAPRPLQPVQRRGPKGPPPCRSCGKQKLPAPRNISALPSDVTSSTAKRRGSAMPSSA